MDHHAGDTGSGGVNGVSTADAFVLLLNFSTVLSRLQDETRILAQRLAILEAEQAEPEALVGAADEAQQPVSQHDQLADD